ncbi:TonB-dependent receptor [Sphingosinicella microcystinivorans]|uniref:TonB-dependent receptor n=1 Tax=Sphingosinicella microcystinivorans TaxID=335406 RepID=UPI0022F3D309|nr:TonB-dependent receptor [Sphingosinicella microcystinivorans]WBX85597.1 TonB-dependent receptor [Sphingosinicella microcystinivorans]
MVLGLAHPSVVQAQEVSSETAAQAENDSKSSPSVEKGGLEEIVVTATKTGVTRLQETPISITAFAAEALERSNLESIKDIGALVPGLSVANNASYAQLYIRGIGTNNVFTGSDPSVTVHLDGVYLARPTMIFTDFVDVDRIEVLRGPQGTLYGRNSAGGTINIISKLPTNNFGLKLTAGYGSYDRLRLSGSVSGPIVQDKVMASLAAIHTRSDGYVNNINTEPGSRDLNNENSYAVRGTLLFALGDRTDLVLTGDYNYYKTRGNAMKPLFVDPLGNPVPIPPGVPVPQRIDDPWTLNVPNAAQKVSNEGYGFSAKLTHEIADRLSLTSITAFRGADSAIDHTESDWTEVYALSTDLIADRQDQFTQELQLNARLGALQLMTGLFYFHEKDEMEIAAFLPLTGTLFYGTSDLRTSGHALAKTNAYAAFGQATYAITDRLSATAGIRYSYEKKSMRSSNVILANGMNVGFGDFTFSGSKSWEAWTPKIGLDYRVTDDVLIYATASKGFKSGGFNWSAAQPAFGPENLWAYEAGVKSEFADRRVRVNASGFYYDYTDLQVQLFENLPGQAPATILANASSSKIKGFELETQIVPVSGLILSGSLAYLDATYGDFITARSLTPSIPVDVSGNRLNSAPKWMYSLSAEYSRGLASIGTVTAHVDYKWQDDVFFSQFNDPVIGQRAYGLLGANISLLSVDERWRLTLWGRNLTKKAYYTTASDYSPFGSLGHINPPRTIEVSLTFKY